MTEMIPYGTKSNPYSVASHRFGRAIAEELGYAIVYKVRGDGRLWKFYPKSGRTLWAPDASSSFQ